MVDSLPFLQISYIRLRCLSRSVHRTTTFLTFYVHYVRFFVAFRLPHPVCSLHYLTRDFATVLPHARLHVYVTVRCWLLILVTFVCALPGLRFVYVFVPHLPHAFHHTAPTCRCCYITVYGPFTAAHTPACSRYLTALHIWAILGCRSTPDSFLALVHVVDLHTTVHTPVVTQTFFFTYLPIPLLVIRYRHTGTTPHLFFYCITPHTPTPHPRTVLYRCYGTVRWLVGRYILPDVLHDS